MLNLILSCDDIIGKAGTSDSSLVDGHGGSSPPDPTSIAWWAVAVGEALERLEMEFKIEIGIH